MTGFRDRADAGRRLAERLERYRGEDVVVVALPRGGVPVAAEVARSLGAPLDVIVVRKVGVPFQPELAMGAVGEDGVRVVNDDVVRAADVGEETWARVEAHERAELERRVRRFRGDRSRVPLAGRTVIVVDDGIATGSTARAACQVARASGARRVVLAVPVAPPRSADELRAVADDVVALETPLSFHAVGQFYEDFSQTTDDEVVRLLTRGLVLFAHGSGSSPQSPRNRFVAEVLEAVGFETRFCDLRADAFDVERLGAQVWEETQRVQQRPFAYFGAGTGAAAALWAAAEPGNDVAAVVSRGGRPDLAGDRLEAVRAPTLLVVGERDEVVLRLNEEAAARMRCEHRIEVVPGATHLFEEPGTLEVVAELARDWLVAHVASA